VKCSSRQGQPAIEVKMSIVKVTRPYKADAQLMNGWSYWYLTKNTNQELAQLGHKRLKPMTGGQHVDPANAYTSIVKTATWTQSWRVSHARINKITYDDTQQKM